MNMPDIDALDAPFFSSNEKLAELERQLYGHVRAAIDFDAIGMLEQHLYMLLTDQHDVPRRLAFDVAAQVIERAFQQAAVDSMRYCEVDGPPPGITDEERKAVAFEPGCPFCELDAQLAKSGHACELADDEPCPCCEELAEEWRAEHAEVLAKAGLAKPKEAVRS